MLFSYFSIIRWHWKIKNNLPPSKKKLKWRPWVNDWIYFQFVSTNFSHISKQVCMSIRRSKDQMFVFHSYTFKLLYNFRQCCWQLLTVVDNWYERISRVVWSFDTGLIGYESPTVRLKVRFLIRCRINYIYIMFTAPTIIRVLRSSSSDINRLR